MLTDKTVKEMVTKLLKDYAHLRDDDRRLCASVWAKQCDWRNMSAHEFLSHFANAEVSHPETIRRMRQKLQAENKELRGNRYEERKNKLDPDIREQLRVWDAKQETML